MLDDENVIKLMEDINNNLKTLVENTWEEYKKNNNNNT